MHPPLSLSPSSVTQPKSLLHPLSLACTPTRTLLPSPKAGHPPSHRMSAGSRSATNSRRRSGNCTHITYIQRCTLTRAGRQPPGKRGPTDGGKTIATVNTFLPGACLTHIPTPSTSLCKSMSPECRVNGKRDGTHLGVAANEWLTLSRVAFSTTRPPPARARSNPINRHLPEESLN